MVLAGQSSKVDPLLPGNGKPGGQWADHRRVINEALFRPRTGVPWPAPCRRAAPLKAA
jgi:hypothetical protein